MILVVEIFLFLYRIEKCMMLKCMFKINHLTASHQTANKIQFASIRQYLFLTQKGLCTFLRTLGCPSPGFIRVSPGFQTSPG
jgi:hypothetical protein